MDKFTTLILMLALGFCLRGIHEIEKQVVLISHLIDGLAQQISKQ